MVSESGAVAVVVVTVAVAVLEAEVRFEVIVDAREADNHGEESRCFAVVMGD